MILAPGYDAIVRVGIATLALAMALIWLGVFARGRYRPVVYALAGGWLYGGYSLGVTGVLTRFDRVPPPMAVMMGATIVVGLVMGFSPMGRRMARDLPMAALVGLQIFRLPLELLMHRAAAKGIAPVELTYAGYNFDIVTGIGALVLTVALAAGAYVPRAALWLWNLYGVGCLVVIAAIAVATSPMVRAFGDDPRHLNTWVLYFPYTWLPTVLVVIAIAGHIVVTRKLAVHSVH